MVTGKPPMCGIALPKIPLPVPWLHWSNQARYVRWMHQDKAEWTLLCWTSAAVAEDEIKLMSLNRDSPRKPSSMPKSQSISTAPSAFAVTPIPPRAPKPNAPSPSGAPAMSAATAAPAPVAVILSVPVPVLVAKGLLRFAGVFEEKPSLWAEAKRVDGERVVVVRDEVEAWCGIEGVAEGLGTIAVCTPEGPAWNCMSWRRNWWSVSGVAAAVAVVVAVVSASESPWTTDVADVDVLPCPALRPCPVPFCAGLCA